MGFSDFETRAAAAIAGGKIAGVVAVVTDREGLTYDHAAGRRAAGGEVPMDLGTQFQIASMTKAIASVAALREVEQGRMTLDGPLWDLLPEFRELQVLEGFGEDGTPILRDPVRPVTLRHLLTHTSGFSYSFLDARVWNWLKATGRPDALSGTRASHLQPLMFDPGEAWGYGISTDWVGLAVEAASGQDLHAYTTEHVFAPLGMVDTTFLPDDDQQARRASLHVKGPDGALIPMPVIRGNRPEVWSGGGGLLGTAPDYARFVRMLMGDGAGVISPETVKGLSEIQTGDLRAGFFKPASATTSLDFDLFPEQHTGWGLATMVTPEPGRNGRQAGTLTWAGIFNTYYWADQTAGVGGVLMTQQLPFGDPVVLELLEALERGAYA